VKKEQETAEFRRSLGECLGQDEPVELHKMSCTPYSLSTLILLSLLCLRIPLLIAVYHAIKAEVVHGLARLDCVDAKTFETVVALKEWSVLPPLRLLLCDFDEDIDISFECCSYIASIPRVKWVSLDRVSS